MPLVKPTRTVANVTDREPMFRFDISPVGKNPTSWPFSTESTMDEKAEAIIPDLSPGRWKIRVYDWLGSRGFDEGLRAEVVVKVGEEREQIEIPLGAYALSGQVTSERETRRLVRIVAVGSESGRVFLSRCDGQGNFVVRYLPSDTYLLHAHDDDGGWCDLGRHRLNKPLVDCGEFQLTEGGYVTGSLDLGKQTPESKDQLRAISAGGIEIPVDEIEADGTYRFGNLQPGKWTIVFPDGDRLASRHEAKVKKGFTTKVLPLTKEE